MCVTVSCLIWGHEDRIRHSAARVYLECAACGRETPGWQLTSHPERTTARAHVPKVDLVRRPCKSLLPWRRLIAASRASGARS
jgi:hypothetical protein